MTMSLLNDDIIEIDPSKDYTNDLVGEGKPYKTVADAMRAILHKEQYVKRLESETSGMRETIGELTDTVKAKGSLSELVTQLASAPKKETPTIGDQHQEPVSPTKEVDIDAVVEAKLAQRDELKSRSENLKTVKTRLQQEFGATFQAQLKSAADGLSMSVEELTEVAERNPNAFYRLVGITPTAQQRQQTTPRSDVNTAGFTPSQGNGKGKSHFDAIKKADPRLYWSPAVQNEMHQTAHQMGIDVFMKS
jgi:hypothetical protein